MNAEAKGSSFFNNSEWFPFNPSATVEEYQRVSTQLESLLGDRSEFGFSQSCSTPTSDGSRSIIVEVLDADQWNLELIEVLQRFLSDLEAHYCILLSEALEDRVLGGCFILISRERIQHWFQDSDEADTFWAGMAFSGPEGIGKRWSATGWIAP